MKTLENILLKACGYTVLIMTVFYLFGLIGEIGAAFISFTTFLTVALFGLLIALAELVLNIRKIHIAFRVLIHYLVLLVAFNVVFISSGNLSVSSGGEIFSAIVIFTVLYAIMFGLVYIIRRFITKGDSFIDKNKFKNHDKKRKESEYKPLYRSDD